MKGGRNVDDFEVDRQARDYALEHGVSYAQALSAVGELAREQSAASFSTVEDFELDRQAREMALKHGLSYSEAMSAAADLAAAKGQARFSAPAVSDEAEMVVRAKQLAVERRVSFAAALGRVVAEQALPAVGFSSPTSGLADVELDARAQHYAFRHGVRYEEALMRVTDGADGYGPGFGAAPSGAVVFAESGPLNYETDPVSALEGQWIEIFKAGTHATTSGESITFTPADVMAIAAGYRPQVREAPLVEGHPEMDAPSQGWVDALQATPDGKLMMRVKQVNPKFAESLKAGRFKKRSAAFYRPGERGNPNLGAWYLRHVGFLGANQPAIAGLRDIDFGAAR